MRRRTSEPAPPSLRRLAVFAATPFAILVLAVVGVLFWASTLLQRTTDLVIRDTRSMSVVSDIELDLNTYQRISNLLLIDRIPELQATRDETVRRLDALMRVARAMAEDAEHRALIERTSRRLSDFYSARLSIETSGLSPPEVVQLSQPALTTALSSLDSLRDLNAARVQRAHDEAQRVARLGTVLAAATSVVLVLGFIAVVGGLRRYVVAPMLELHDAVIRFQNGDVTARAPEAGSGESRELAAAFNRMLEAQVRQRDEQLAFAAGVAHDLRHPLTGLKLGIEALEQSVPREHARTLGMLDRQIEHLDRMIGDLLDAARIEAGRLELTLQVLDLCQVADDFVPRAAAIWPRHHFLIRHLPVPITVRGDPLRLEQVLSNLVSNAVKFSPEGSQIVVTVREEEATVLLAVTDEGIGISADAIAGLFVPFQRQRPDLAPGIGLGLSVVRRIVMAHGGTIAVESLPGRGTTFLVRLPRAEMSARASLQVNQREPGPRPSA